ncbi:PHD finger domain-containing protein [Sporobolomyces salmoneus]|uniref:PHD finger domain-containing protein n=1 Tax=Sporobolomyces salmoneus TaxID=183962 RepID=UPI0031775A8E
MPRPSTRARSTPMSNSFSTTSSAAADDFQGLSLASGSSSLSSRHSTASPSPTPTPQPQSMTRGGGPKRRERQTRLQEHLRTVKPGSSSSSSASSSKPRQSLGFSASGSSASKTVPTKMMMDSPAATTIEGSPSSSRPKRKAAQKVVMQEFEVDSDPEQELGDEDEDAAMEDDQEEEEDDVIDDLAEESLPRGRKTAARRSRGRKAPRASTASKKIPREREISSLSTVSAGIDVEGMDEDEVQNRLQKEKNELMERLAQHGINPQADVLDRALVTLSNSNEKLTVDSFLRALSSLDTNRSPTSSRLPLPLPIPPPALSVQVPSNNQAKRVSFSTLESPSTPSSSHSSIFPSPPSKSVSLPISTPLAGPNALPAFASNGSVSPTSVFPIPSTSTSAASTIVPPPAATTAPSSLFGNSVPGMGRIALTRRHTYLGVPSASDPVPSLLPAFNEPVARQSFSSPAKPAPSLNSSVSKLQSWLDDDDSEEEEDSVVKASKAKANEKNGSTEAKKQPVEEDEEMEIRVGGKSVKVLRKRQLEENDDDEEEAKASTLSPKGKGKQRALECLCGEAVSVDESSHGTVSCNLCETSFHLACLNVNSRRHLPLEWTCERCETNSTSPSSATKEAVETPQKRLRTERETTPPRSIEPTFVTSTFSPIPRGNFASLADVALAPSPTSSPKRQFAHVPESPVLLSSGSKVAIPATPQFGKDLDPRSDYSPCSPLFNRKSRSRLVSGVFDSAPFGNDWTHDHVPSIGGGGGINLFDGPQFGDSLNPHAHDWHDITMTPSRGLGSTSSAGGGWETPFSSRSRQPSTLQTISHHHHHLRTPSQDIFSGSALDYVQGGRHTAPAQMFAQRLFGGNGNGNEDPITPSRTMTNGTNTSPLSLKRSTPLRHGRNPSSSYILPPHAFTSPSVSSSSNSIFSQYPPTPQSASNSNLNAYLPKFGNFLSPSRSMLANSTSAAMKTSFSAPGMMRSASDGLGIGYDERGGGGGHQEEGEEERRRRIEAAHFDDLLL